MQKCPKSFPKVSKRVLHMFRGVFFWKSFLTQCSLEGRVVERFQKNQKTFQNSKKAQNRSQECPNVFWTCFGAIFSKKFFCPVFLGRSSLRKFSKKTKLFKNCKNARNRSQKCPNVLWTYFGLIFSEIIFAQCSIQGWVVENFQKNRKFLKIAKMPEIVPKSVQTCVEHVLRRFFRKFFLLSVP